MLPLYDTLRPRRFPVINWLLIALNALVFYHELTLGGQGLYRFIQTWGLVPSRLIDHPAAAWFTIFSSMFIHGGWFHILSNMWILLLFGDNIEDRLGAAPYLLFYMSGGVAAALLQTFFSMGSSMPQIGASGAIAAVLGAYILIYPRARVASLVPILFIFTLVELPAYIFLGFWFILQLFSGWLALQGADAGNIAWWAHIGGFVFGFLTVKLYGGSQPYRSY